MFESVNPPAAPRRNQFVTLVASVAAHAVLVTLLIVIPLLYFSDQLPEPPDMLAFVAAGPPPPPPPPPPPAPRQAQPAKPTTAPQNAPQLVQAAAPIEAPTRIEAERLPEVPVQEFGGVEGGLAGGIAGGVVGGVEVMPAPPPPPPPPPPAPKPQIVRVGGDIQTPTLLHRVEPEYPLIAVNARKEGVVILEATVDTEGRVRTVRVLRSDPLLQQAAVEAVKQWRYSPLQLNGQPQNFIVTVTVSFNLGTGRS